jgi:hypothetical protein
MRVSSTVRAIDILARCQVWSAAVLPQRLMQAPALPGWRRPVTQAVIPGSGPAETSSPRSTYGEPSVDLAAAGSRRKWIPSGGIDYQAEESMIRAIVTLLVLGFVGMTVLGLLFGLVAPLVVSPTKAIEVRERLRRVK